MTTIAFNKDIHVLNTVDHLIKKFGINCIVETGTSGGDTTFVLGEMYPNIEIHTIEVVEDAYLKTKKRLSKWSNITCHLGSSEKVMETLLPELKGKKIMFYLDAHWYDYWPIQDELLLIAKHFQSNALVVIDDFSVPFRNFQCDEYKGNALSLKFIENELLQAFPEPFFFFNENTCLSRAVGKLYLFPNQWMSSFETEADIIWKQDGNYYYSTI